MNPESAAADQMLRMELMVTEFAVKLAAKGAVNLAALLVAVLRNEKQIAGKSDITKLLQSGAALTTFPLPAEKMKAFSDLAKEYGVMFSIVRDKDHPETVDIIVRQDEAAPGYIRDEEVKTFRVKRGETTEIVWENTPQQGQIQITKKSKDDNPINGLPAGTLLQGATFEIYDKAGNVVDTVVSNERGVAVSKLLPLGRYTIKETKAPAYYGASGETFEAEIEFSGQIVRLEVLNESVYTNVSIAKSGPKQVVPGQPIRWTVSHIANNSTVSLQSFYWRDTLPYQAVTLDKIVTGTYNARLSYKIVYRTNYNQNYRTLADNLSTAQNRTIQANPTALGLKSGEVVTDFMFVFGNVPAGFRCVETPYVYGNVRSSVAGTAFVNKADVGGLHNQQWIMSNDAWTTTIYRVTKPVLPQTGW